MRIGKNANKLADVFADERIDLIMLAQQTNLAFTPTMNKRLHSFFRWHTHNTNKHQSEIHPLDLDNLDGIG